MNARRWHVLGGTLAVLWLFVRGVTLSPRVIAGELLLGLAVGVPIAYVFRRLYPGRIDLSRTARATPYAALYLAAFTYDLLTANFAVARRVLSPVVPLEPRVIEVPLRVQTPLAITTIANSITLTPGTLTMDHDEPTNTLYVHAMAGTDRESVVAPIRRWEDYALVIFDEEGKPGDPVPEPVVAESPDGEGTSTRDADTGGESDGE